MAGTDGMQKMLPESHPKRKHPLHPLCARTAFSCNKLFLFVYALMFLFVGIILMAIGVLVELYRDRLESLNTANRLALPTALLIVVGLVIVINALCGMVGTIMEKPLLLKVFLVTTIVCFLLQIAIGIIAFVYREQLPRVVSSEFMFAIRRYTKDNEVKKALDWFQTRYVCCGFSSYKDYQEENEEFACKSGDVRACGVPKSCCIQREGVTLPVSCGYGVVGNTTMFELIYVEGCTDALLHWLMDHLDLVGAIALGFAIPQIFGILLAYYFLRKVKEYRVWYRVDHFRT